MALNLDGHDLFIINSHWLFDLTTFIGYRTWKNKEGKLTDIKEAYRIIDNSSESNREYIYTTSLDNIPVGVIRKTYKIIDNYYSSAYAIDRVIT